jgi:hypothetical protein
MRLALVLGAVVLAGCAINKIDPCKGQSGTCLALEVETTDQLSALDSLVVHVWGAEIDHLQTTTPTGGAAVRLPAAVALLFPSLAAGAQVPVSLAIDAQLRGKLVAAGSTATMLRGGQRTAATVMLSAGGGVTPTVVFEQPSADAHVNAMVRVAVSVSPNADFVDLLVDGKLLATRTPPALTFEWDSQAVAEGAHTLVARATLGGHVVASAPLSIVVDRTPPTVVSQSPQPGSNDFDTLTPITVVFSEPMAKATVTPQTVLVASVTGDAVPLAQPTLSSDGKTLSIMVGDLPPLPTQLTVAFGRSMTDLAGNPLVDPGWSFTVPTWLQVGGTASPAPFAGQLVAGPNGKLAVARFGGSAGVCASISRWNGDGASSWQQLGDGIPCPGTGSSAQQIALAMDGTGQPVVLLGTIVPPSTTYTYAAYQWSDATLSWNMLGGPIVTADNIQAAIAEDASCGPLVAYTQSNGTAFVLYVVKWNGTDWQPLAGPLSSSYQDVGNPQIACDGQGHISVAFEESVDAYHSAIVMNWDGTQFKNAAYNGGITGLNPTMGTVNQPRLALAGGGQPVVSFQEGGGLFVFQGYVGGFMRLSGEPVSIGVAVALAVDSLNRPIVVYHDTKIHPDAFVIRWDGSTWQRLGADPVFVDLKNPLAIDSHGRAVVAGASTDGSGIVLRANQ